MAHHAFLYKLLATRQQTFVASADCSLKRLPATAVVASLPWEDTGGPRPAQLGGQYKGAEEAPRPSSSIPMNSIGASYS